MQGDIKSVDKDVLKDAREENQLTSAVRMQKARTLDQPPPNFVYSSRAHLSPWWTQLRRTGLWATTLLVFSGDNGGYLGSGGDNHPRRGGKFSDFSGGIRVAAFVTGGLLPPSRRLQCAGT